MATIAIDNARGALWMAANVACFTTANFLVRKIGGQLPTAEIAFIRSISSVIVMIPAFVHYGPAIFRTTSPRMHIIRIVCATIGVFGNFYALAHLPLATAISLMFTRPLFTVLLAALVLGEIVRWRRGLATAIGFAGTVLILGPSGLGFGFAAFMALVGALAIAGSLAVIRQQAAIDGPLTLFAWFSIGTAVLTGIPALFTWQPPTAEQWTLLIAVGITSTAGQYVLIKALTHGEASVMAPIDFTQIVLAAVFGYLVFGEVPTLWTLLGAATIVLSALYIVLRESRLKTTVRAIP